MSGGIHCRAAAYLNPPMQWTEPAGRLLVVRETVRRRLTTDRPYVLLLEGSFNLVDVQEKKAQ